MEVFLINIILAVTHQGQNSNSECTKVIRNNLSTFLFGGAGLEFLLHFDRNLVVLHAAEERAPRARTQPRCADWEVSLDLQTGWGHNRSVKYALSHTLIHTHRQK